MVQASAPFLSTPTSAPHPSTSPHSSSTRSPLKMRLSTLATIVLPLCSVGGALAQGYSCDPNSCKLPTCNCASTTPPGGLSPVSTPLHAHLIHPLGQMSNERGDLRGAGISYVFDHLFSCTSPRLLFASLRFRNSSCLLQTTQSSRSRWTLSTSSLHSAGIRMGADRR